MASLPEHLIPQKRNRLELPLQSTFALLLIYRTHPRRNEIACESAEEGENELQVHGLLWNNAPCIRKKDQGMGFARRGFEATRLSTADPLSRKFL